MVPDSKIAQAAEKMVDKPFHLGDLTGELGFDCLNSLKTFYDEIGFDFPTEFEGYNQYNYSDKWNENPEKSRDVLIRFLKGLGEHVENVNFCRRGDLLILEAQAPKIERPRIEGILNSIGKMFPNLVKEARKILEGKKLLIFPAIYLGNGHMFMVVTTDRDNKGPRIVPLRFFKKYVKEVRRLV